VYDILNNRGQFSIIAALLVAVVLIATVIITYSTIRYSPVNEQPPIQIAIDETNFAIKQILGFTVGYYGSVLQVTGNSSYARTLASNYLQSGLFNIANMHPEWGASFNVNRTELATYWYTNSSYSLGSLTVMYNLTGLGISGITYQASCKLGVQILETIGNQSCLVVERDEDEPVVSLGKRNLRFYRYDDTNSIWEQASPSTEPTSYANGTYQIDFPSGVDPYSYFVEVEDPRGIIVVASSFSHYSISFSWNPIATSYYAVNGSSSMILGAPDGNYATLAEAATCEVTDYQTGTDQISQVFFNIRYYGNVSGTLEWHYRLNSGSWIKIEDLPEGGNAASPLTRTFNATSLRPSWTWNDVNNTDIRFFNNDAGASENAFVDAMYVTVQPQVVGNYSTLQNSTIVVELLQNGTMRWLGQNLQMTTQAKPIPPVPVKAIHVNQMVNGINQEVPFQVEDWNHNYQVPVGLASNGTVFSNRQMIVFLVDHKTSKATVWWNGSDEATQTPYAYVNRYFTDNPSTRTVGTTSSTARLMRLNSREDNTDPESAYVIYNGVVRDIVQGEPEYSNGVDNCPNFYAHVVLTLPANTTYYTYQLRLMFVESQRTRIITDLCPIRLTGLSGQSTTENGTLAGVPINSSATASFYNYSISTWAHHWSQILNGAKGAGIMFTDEANKKLYAFDPIAGSKTGALDVNAGAGTIQLAPVKMAQANFTYALDVTWHGAVVTCDGTTPIYQEEGGIKTGLWMLVEYPPTVTVSTES